jgi:hypothetical protein
MPQLDLGQTIRRRAQQQGYIAEYFDGLWIEGWAFIEAEVGNYVTDRQSRLTDEEALGWLDENASQSSVEH